MKIFHATDCGAGSRESGPMYSLEEIREWWKLRLKDSSIEVEELNMLITGNEGLVPVEDCMIGESPSTIWFFKPQDDEDDEDELELGQLSAFEVDETRLLKAMDKNIIAKFLIDNA